MRLCLSVFVLLELLALLAFCRSVCVCLCVVLLCGAGVWCWCVVVVVLDVLPFGSNVGEPFWLKRLRCLRHTRCVLLSPHTPSRRHAQSVSHSLGDGEKQSQMP